MPTARLGIALECTCTPYYLHETSYGDHLAWSESSAVSYANSVIGARTNREGGPGCPCCRAHRERHPAMVSTSQKNGGRRLSSVYMPIPGTGRSRSTGPSGTMPGNLSGTGSRSFPGSPRDGISSRRSGLRWQQPVPLRSITWKGSLRKHSATGTISSGLEAIPVEETEIRQLKKEIPVEAVALGCPHCSPEELVTLARLLSGKRVKIPLYIFASQGVIEACRKTVDSIEKSGAKVYADTCMVVSPVMERYDAIMVNSGKALAYVPDMCGAVARIGTTEECVRVATE